MRRLNGCAQLSRARESSEAKTPSNLSQGEYLERGGTCGCVLSCSAEQDTNILNRGDQIILYLLPP